MLTGIYTYNVDQKGRIVMPGRFLEEIGNPFLLGGHPNGYLVAASSPEAITDKNTIRGYVECRIKDRTGRFVIPNALRDFAELGQHGEATVVGIGDEVEIWNKHRWESQARLGGFANQNAPEDDRPVGSRGRSNAATASQGFDSQPFASNASRFTQDRFGFQQSAPPPQVFPPHAPVAFPQHYNGGAGVQQKSIYGQPYIEVEGSLNFAETDKVRARLENAMRGKPRTIFLDLRRVDTVDASFVMAMEPATYQLAAQGGRLAILTERQDVATLIHRVCSHTHLRVFPNLEAALWWLVDEGQA